VLDCDIIELEAAAPSQLLDEGAAVGNVKLDGGATALLARYGQYVESYKARIAAELGKRFGLIRGMPGHIVKLSGRQVTITYDERLDRRLLEVYVTDGWPGILKVGEALASLRSAPYFDIVHAFFEFTRNMLLVLIRDALTDIERRANADMIGQLQVSANLINNAWFQLNVQIKYEIVRGESHNIEDQPPDPGDKFAFSTPLYNIGNSGLSSKLYIAITEAVREREREEARKHEENRAHLEDVLAEGADQSSRSSAPGGPGLEQDLAAEEAWLVEHNAQLEKRYGAVHDLCQLAVLAIPLLHAPFSQRHMENTLAAALVQFRGEAERVTGVLAKRLGWVAQALPGPTQDTPLEKLYDPKVWLERDVVALALKHTSDDHGYLSMLSEATLRRLVETGVVEKDTFEWIVLSHYLTALIVGVEVERESHAFVEGLFQILMKISALMSLVLIFTPASLVTRGIQLVLGLGLLIFQGYSMAYQLAQLDRQLGLQLVELDRDKAMEIARVSELLQIRGEMIDELTTTVIKELALIAAAKMWPLFKQLAHLRGYYFDLEILATSP
jgi:hypothetical protein